MTNANNHNRVRSAHATAATGTGVPDVYVVRIWDKALGAMQSRIGLVVGGDDDTKMVRLWMGRAFGRLEVRWSHTPRAISMADMLRPATPREVTLGRRT